VSKAADTRLIHGGLRIDVLAYRVSIDGVGIRLSTTSFRLLLYLIEHSQRVVGRDELVRVIGNGQSRINPRLVDVHIARLRRALRAGGGGEFIRTVRNVGYIIDIPMDRR
jgi:two-component system, OmpR family, phosphate regulon response regulator PhoB